MSRRQPIAHEIDTNPYLEKAMVEQFLAMGYVINKAKPLVEQLDRIPVAVIGRIHDGIAGSPKVAFKAAGGVCNLIEDLAFGAINSIGPGPEIPSYRQSLMDAKKRRRW
jgi:hypothetical protein